MPGVCCRVQFCAHNVAGEICNAAEILIEEDRGYGREQTGCATFISRSFSASRVSLDNVNYAGLVAQAFDRANRTVPQVSCRVSGCARRREADRCSAGEIQILPQSALWWTDTFCEAFMELKR